MGTILPEISEQRRTIFGLPLWLAAQPFHHLEFTVRHRCDGSFESVTPVQADRWSVVQLDREGQGLCAKFDGPFLDGIDQRAAYAEPTGLGGHPHRNQLDSVGLDGPGSGDLTGRFAVHIRDIVGVNVGESPSPPLLGVTAARPIGQTGAKGSGCILKRPQSNAAPDGPLIGSEPANLQHSHSVA